MSSCRAPSSRFCCVLRYGLSIAGLLLLAPAPVVAQSGAEVREFQKKAECINSFTRFVDWPARKFAQPDAPFVIGVLQLAVPLSWSPTVIPSNSLKISEGVR
jgi:hypothetical protein